MDLNRERLEAFQSFLQTADIEDRAHFQRAIVEARELLQLSEGELARLFKCARPAIEIWSRGEGAPYQGMRRVIFERLGQAAIAHLMT